MSSKHRKARRKKDVRMLMGSFLRQLATSFKNNRNKLITIVKYQDELGPEWTTRVVASLDDIIREFQHLRAALEAGNAKYDVKQQKTLPTPEVEVP